MKYKEQWKGSQLTMTSSLASVVNWGWGWGCYILWLACYMSLSIKGPYVISANFGVSRIFNGSGCSVAICCCPAVIWQFHGKIGPFAGLERDLLILQFYTLNTVASKNQKWAAYPFIFSRKFAQGRGWAILGRQSPAVLWLFKRKNRQHRPKISTENLGILGSFFYVEKSKNPNPNPTFNPNA